jgi:Domain of unknown function (DUF1737)
MRYKIVSHGAVNGDMEDFEEFANAVQMQVQDGWIPQGGVSVASTDDNVILAQALIKES